MAEGDSERPENGLPEAWKDDSRKQKSSKSRLYPAATVGSLILAFLLVIFTVVAHNELEVLFKEALL